MESLDTLQFMMTDNNKIFDFHPRVRLIFGENSLDRLGECAADLDGASVLVVTDPGIVAAGHVKRAVSILQSAGIPVRVFDSVRENPDTTVVDECVDAAREMGINLLVGLGGGSSIDTAKGCNFILTNGGRIEDYWGFGKAKMPMLPMIAIPTTAGTGSECQSYALISDANTHRKMACGDPKAAADIAILDPVLTVSQPRNVAAVTGLDAIAHALESAVTLKRSPVSSLFAFESFRLTQYNYTKVLSSPTDLNARGAMLLGAAYAGIAIENSMLGGAHALANPLTARFGIVHGWAVGLMLPWVVRFNGQDVDSRRIYAELARRCGLLENREEISHAPERIAVWLESIMDAADLPRSLDVFGISESDITGLAEEAAQQWTGTFNPRPLSVDVFQSLYRQALHAF